MFENVQELDLCTHKVKRIVKRGKRTIFKLYSLVDSCASFDKFHVHSNNIQKTKFLENCTKGST